MIDMAARKICDGCGEYLDDCACSIRRVLTERDRFRALLVRVLDRMDGIYGDATLCVSPYTVCCKYHTLMHEIKQAIKES